MKSPSKKSASLNPEFDEVQEAINAQLINEELQDLLADIADDPDVALVCDTCNQVFVFDIKFVEDICTECGDGLLEIVDGDGVVIELPKSMKEGGSSYKQLPGSSVVNGYNNWSPAHSHYMSDRCEHTGDKVLFEFNGKKLFGANNTGLKEWSGKWDLIIDLAGIVQVPSPSTFISTTAPGRFRELKQYINTNTPKLPSELLRLNWTDMSVPPVTLDFWINMWNLLPEKTVICCFGGHGRTGTCLASLMIATGVDYYMAVETVHTEHCKKAIETEGQEAYLHKLYLEYLNRQLKVVEAAKAQAEIINIKEDIDYALKNAPGKGSKAYSFQGQNDDSPKGHEAVTYYGANYKNTGAVDEKSELGKALASGLPVKTVGTRVFVKECCQTGCYKSTCDNMQHVDWVEWSKSLAKIDLEIEYWNSEQAVQ